MRKVKAMQTILRNQKAAKAKAFDLLKILQSEINHELSSPFFQKYQAVSPGDFTVEWDTPNSSDVVLQKKCDTGEDVAVSAVLGPVDNVEDGTYPRGVLMKVCIKKPGLSSLLHFKGEVIISSLSGPEFDIYSADYLRSTNSTGPKNYKGPLFSELDSDLQDAFRDYLKTRGIGESLMNFLLVHMHKKEENQYVNWLQKLQGMVSQTN